MYNLYNSCTSHNVLKLDILKKSFKKMSLNMHIAAGNQLQKVFNNHSQFSNGISSSLSEN